MEGTKTPHSAHGEEIPGVRLGQVAVGRAPRNVPFGHHWSPLQALALGGWKRKHAQNSQEFKQFSELKPVRDYWTIICSQQGFVSDFKVFAKLLNRTLTTCGLDGVLKLALFSISGCLKLLVFFGVCSRAVDLTWNVLECHERMTMYWHLPKFRCGFNFPGYVQPKHEFV